MEKPAEEVGEFRKIPELPAGEVDESNAVDTGLLSVKEAQQLSSGRSENDLAQEAAENDHNRKERFREFFEDLLKKGVWIAFWLSVVFGCVWAWHLLMPTKFQWLDESQVDHIQNIFTGGLLAGLLGDLFKKRLSNS